MLKFDYDCDGKFKINLKSLIILNIKQCLIKMKLKAHLKFKFFTGNGYLD